MASNLNDLNKGVVATRNLNDGNRAYFGGVSTGTLNTVTLTDLKSRGATSDNLNTAWGQVLTLLGYVTGTLQDRQKAFWGAGGAVIIGGIDMTALSVYLNSQGWVTANITATQFDETITTSLITEANMLSCVFTGIPAPLTVDLKDAMALQGKVCP